MGSSKPPPPKTEVAAIKPGGRCPICTAPTDVGFRPFCSRRCADVDLSRWLRGGYAIAGHADVDEDGDDAVASAPEQRTRMQSGDRTPDDDEE